MLLVYVLRHVLYMSQALLIRHFSHKIPPIPPPFYPASTKLHSRIKTLSFFRGRCDVPAVIGIHIRFNLFFFSRVFVVSIIFAGN